MKRSLPEGFTLVELLVVMAIVGLVAIVAIPVIGSLDGRQVTDAARIFTGAITGTRDTAIRYNEPRGFRLLPDPTLTIPAPGQPAAGTLQLVYNRIIPIEPAGDYSQGKVTIGPKLQAGVKQADFPPILPFPDMDSYPVLRYAFNDSAAVSPPSQVLMIEESPYVGGYTVGGQPNSPTNWYWNVRVGDKIRINGSGREYTIIGPCTINPWASSASGNQGNLEMFVNVGRPGTLPPLTRDYYTRIPTTPPKYDAFGDPLHPEFLFVVNGEDDDKDGYIDEGFDGFNQNPPPKTGTALPTDNTDIDEPFEWETETWRGTQAAIDLNDRPPVASAFSPSAKWVDDHFGKGTADVDYVIKRRPVPSPGAREVLLPAGTVIDATTWNTTRERSRMPIQPGSLYCDVMLNPSGLYIPTTQYSTPTSADPLPFLHFWITSRDDVFPRGALWGLATDGTPNHNPSDPKGSVPYVYYELPLSSDTPGYSVSSSAPALKNDRRLVTMFTQSGLIVTNTIETIPAPSDTIPGEGFSTGSVNHPFLKAQQSLRGER